MRLGLLLLLACAMISHGDPVRAVWFWGSTTLPDASPSPYGSAMVVSATTSAAEDETIAFFTSHNVKRVYGSYQNRPVSEPGVIANWNSKLAAAGIQSQILLDGNAVDEDAVDSLLVKITNRLINFNAAYSGYADSQFAGLHLDLEPQGLPEWDSGTPAVKRALLDELLLAYEDIRDHLDTEGLPTFPVYADIPFFWDKLPADGGSVGWADSGDRDSWYAAIDVPLDGVSVMTFSKDTYAELATATEYERTGPLAEARVAIQPKCGPDELWPTLLHFYTVMHQLEVNLGPTEAVDIENYAFWRYALSNCGIEVGPPIAVTSVATGTGALPWPPGAGGTGGTIGTDPGLVFPGVAGHLHKVRTATSLQGPWTELVQLRTVHPAEPEMFCVPVPAQGRRRFWQVEIVPDPPQ